MIKTFKCKQTEDIFNMEISHRLPGDIQQRAYNKLRILHNATSLYDLRAVPGNRLERLAGGRGGQHSIRINDQWRICFVWRDDDGNAYEVEIVDYHH